MEEIILKKDKFERGLETLVNNSGLPAFVVRQTLRDCLEQIISLEQRQLNEAKLMKEEPEEMEEKK